MHGANALQTGGIWLVCYCANHDFCDEPSDFAASAGYLSAVCSQVYNHAPYAYTVTYNTGHSSVATSIPTAQTATDVRPDTEVTLPFGRRVYLTGWPDRLLIL